MYMNFLRLLLILSFFSACSHDHKKAQHSFYYWKTSFSSDSNMTAFISKENISHFYIRYFDVAWNNYYNMPVPVAEISGFNNANSFTQNQYSPVVFITNSCFQKMDSSWCDSLAIKISTRIKFITAHLQQNIPKNNFSAKIIKHNKIDEIQVDCDWTVSTKEKYFRFLSTFKKLFPDKKISATIRLYPYKYPNLMGIPPVDKGLLICYNITDIKDNNNPNSVFSLAALKQYLNAKEYPLPLDIALPVFGWYAWFSNGQFKNIIYPGTDELLSSSNHSFRKVDNNYVLLSDTVMNNNYLREGDILRLEYPSPADLEDAAKLLQQKFPNTERVCFYHWDKILIKKYEKTITDIYNRF